MKKYQTFCMHMSFSSLISRLQNFHLFANGLVFRDFQFREFLIVVFFSRCTHKFLSVLMPPCFVCAPPPEAIHVFQNELPYIHITREHVRNAKNDDDEGRRGRKVGKFSSTQLASSDSLSSIVMYKKQCGIVVRSFL